MGVSENRGTPKSSILIGFSIINHPFWGTPIFGNTHMAIKVSLCQNANPHMWSKGKKRVKKSSLKGKSAKRDLFFSNWWWVVHLHCASFVSDSKRISLNQSQSKALNWFVLHALFLWYAIPTRFNSYLKYLSLVLQPRPFFFRDKSTRKNHRGEPNEADASASVSNRRRAKHWNKSSNLRVERDRTYGPLPMQFMNVLCFVLVGSSGSCIVTIRLPTLFGLLVYTWLWSITSISIVTRRACSGGFTGLMIVI